MPVAGSPRGGDRRHDEVNAWRAAGLDVVVSLTEPDEATAQVVFAHEAGAGATRGITLHAFPLPHPGAPPSKQTVSGLAGELVRAAGSVLNAVKARVARESSPLRYS